MSLRSLISRLPKRSMAVLSVLAATVMVPAMLNAWGPARTTFTVAQPADHVVFNSITDNPVVGDERQFVGIKDNANTAAGGWQNSVVAQPGHEYLVRVYVHNNAAANLNLVAQNTRVTAALSTATGKSVPITAYVSADNASPQKVWADINLTSSQDFNIAYVPGSTMLYNNVTGQAGRSVSDSIVNPGGALIGYQANDGKIPGCFQYAGYLTFKVKAQFAPASSADFTVSKMVSKHGANQWVENYTAQPGETVDYLLKYKNTGTVVQNNVMISDKLPAGMTYVTGSTVLGNPSHPAGVKTNDGVTAGGINVGGYNPGQNAWVIFSAKAPAEAALVCGANTLTNTESVTTDYGTKSDTAVVTINKTCVPPTPVYKCDSLTVDKISRTEFKFTTAKTVTNATYVKTVFVIKNAAGATVATVNDTDGVYNYTQTTPGTYTVTATVVVTVNGAEKTATSAACSKTFTVEAAPTHPAVEITKMVNNKKSDVVKANVPFEYEITVKNTGDVALVNAKVSDSAPAGITFLSADAGTIANNAWTATVSLQVSASKTFKIQAVAKTYVAGVTTNKACVDATEVPGSPDDCDTATTTMTEYVTACNLDTKKIENNVPKSKIDNVHYTEDLTKCQPKPVLVKACNLDTMKVEENVDKTKIDGIHYTEDLTKCAPKPELVTACNLDTMKVETNVDKTKIDNVHYTLDLTKCQPKPVLVTACNLDTMKIEQNVDKSKIDNVHYTLDLTKCKPAPVKVKACNLETKKVENDVDSSKIDNVHYTTDLAKCETPKTPMCTVPGKETMPANSPECKTTPTTPVELPHTGIADGFLSVLGLGSLVGVTSAYVASRRSLNQ